MLGLKGDGVQGREGEGRVTNSYCRIRDNVTTASLADTSREKDLTVKIRFLSVIYGMKKVLRIGQTGVGAHPAYYPVYRRHFLQGKEAGA
jgi:hypothetical protein